MIIHSIEKIKNRKNSFKVRFDNGDNIIIAADTIVKFGLKTGLSLPAPKYAEILASDRSGRVTADALALVAKRSYSSKGLYDKLIQKGYEPQHAKSAVERLKELNYIDDAKFAKNYAAYLISSGKGEFAIKAELEKRGIPKNLLCTALDFVKKEEEPHEQIIKIIRSKFKKLDFKDKNEIRKAASFFLRRGFSSESISKALREYKNISLEENF